MTIQILGSPQTTNGLSFAMAAVAISSGEQVGLNTAGYLTLASAAATVVVIGIATESVDNSAGDPGDKFIEVRLSRTVELFSIPNAAAPNACDQTSVGHDVFVASSGSVRKTSNSGAAARAGKCWGFDKDLNVLVEYDCDPDAADITASEERLDAIEAVAAPSMQAGDATLATGTIVVGAGITVAANSEVIPIVIGDITGTTNFGGLRERKSARAVGGPGVGAITLDAVGSDGLLDADAAGAIRYVILTPPSY